MMQVYIAGVLVNTKEDVPYSVTKQLTEIRQPESRSASYTTTINVVGDKESSALFKQLFIVNKDNNFNTFDPNIRVPAYVSKNGVTVIEGYAQLIKINKVEDEVNYEVVIYSSEKNLFSLMGDKYITGNTSSANDIDLDSTANIVNVATSAFNETSANSFVSSSNVCSPLWIENGMSEEFGDYPYLTLDYRQQRMAVKFRHIWDRIFAKHNVVYNSTFISSSAFSPFVYVDTHSTLPKLTNTQYNNLSCFVNRTSSGAYFNYSATSGQVFDFNNEVRDAGGLFNLTTDKFTANSQRNYTAKAIIRLNLAIEFPTGKGSGTDTFEHSITVKLLKNTSTVASSIFTRNEPVTGTQTSGAIVFNRTIGLGIDTSVLLASGDTLSVVVSGTFTNSTPPVTSATGLCSYHTNSRLVIEPTDREITVNDRYLPSAVIASEHKQKDFILDVIKMFNMYLLYDLENERYILEPRDSFYTLGSTYDITNDVDRSQTINITPVGELTWKELQLKPTNDKDYYSELYSKNWGEVYGQQNVINNNEFVKETKKVEIYFSPPMLTSVKSFHPKLHHIYTFDGNTRKAIDGRARYAYWGGWVEADSTYHRVKNINNTYLTFEGYPYAGEFNNPNTPTVSALFGSPREIFYRSAEDIAITTNNLYKYYENSLTNQIDLNAKIINCYYYNPILDSQLKLYDTVVFDGVICLISKLEISNGLTKLELIQYER